MYIRQYEIIGELGAGGMGVVLKAFDPSLRRTVAIKMIGGHDDIMATLHEGKRGSKSPALDQDKRMALIREARAVSNLRHPNIVEVLDYGQQHGLLFIVMEYLEGNTLDHLIPSQADIPFERKLDIMSQVCDGLAYAHDQGLVHRDIKPSNIFLLANGRIKIVDFGLANKLTNLPALRPVLAGTPPYMAPEVFQRVQCDSRTDIWSTGITLFQLLTGELPFVGSSIGELLREIVQKPVPTLTASIPRHIELDSILKRALAKNPAHRYKSAYELACDLRGIGSPELWNKLFQFDVNHTTTFEKTAFADIRCSQHKLRFSIGLVDIEGRVPIRPVQIKATRFKTRLQSINFVQPLIVILSVLCLAANFLPTHYAFLYAIEACIIVVACLVFYAVFYTGATFAEKLSSIPRCRSCKRWMTIKSEWNSHVQNDAVASQGYADCLTALHHGLWSDAAKLMQSYGRKDVPLHSETVVSPPIRLQLAFFDCDLCGHRAARLIAHDKAYSSWIARPEQVEVYGKLSKRGAGKPSRTASIGNWGLVLSRVAVSTLAMVRINIRLFVFITFFALIALYVYTHPPRFQPRRTNQQLPTPSRQYTVPPR
jgi:hypothetical protein